MWSVKFEILFGFSICVCCYAEEFSNSSTVLNVTDFSENSTTIYLDSLANATNAHFNYTGNINRIVGGRPLNIAEAPYQVALYDDGFFICGGSIISADWVLTAAHCIKGGGKFKIRAGSQFRQRGGVLRSVRYAVVNAGYSERTMSHDIGLIRLTKRLRWSRNIRPIRLAQPNMRLPKKLLVSGWGSRKESTNKPSNVLIGVTVSKVSHKTCKYKFRQDFPVTRLVICAASQGKDACQGDSGSPLANNGIQYGIVSYGIGCARKAFPGVYTNTRKQFLWIRKVIQRFGGAMPRYLRN